MLVFLFSLTSLAITTISNLVSWLVFSVSGYLLVLIIQGLRVPGEAIQCGLEQIAEAIKSCWESILELLIEATSSLISEVFNLLIEGLTSSVAVTGSAIGGLVDKTRDSLVGLLKDTTVELAEGFSDMVSTIVSNAWNNFKEAIEYVKENA